MNNADITKLIIEMHATLGGMNAKLNELSVDLAKHSDASKETKKEVEKIQQDISRAKGALAALLGLGAIGTAFKQLF